MALCINDADSDIIYLGLCGPHWIQELVHDFCFICLEY